MSIFDSIMPTISSLFEEGSDLIDDVVGSDGYKIARNAIKGYGAFLEADEAENSEERSLLGFVERNSRMQDTDQQGKFPTKVRNVPYGAQQYSADAGTIQREWQAYLTGVAGAKTVPGKRYSELN